MPVFTSQEKRYLTKLLACAVNQGKVLSLDGLHGYLYGLAINPEPIFPSEWLPGIFGEEMLELPGEEEGNHLMGSLLEVYNRMTQQSQDKELTFPFDIRTMDIEDIPRVRAWTHGFFLAISMFREVWGLVADGDFDDDEPEPYGVEDYGEEDVASGNVEMRACFSVVMGVAFPERIPELFHDGAGNPVTHGKKGPNLEATLLTLLTDAVASLQKYANSARDGKGGINSDDYQHHQQLLRVEKIGRNDPCTCGSGAKYKKCCGK